ncbi:MAG: CBS domain-containing protein [Opitutales bacterium]|nr:CBS domain-containing protein [Opitutales bacterium]
MKASSIAIRVVDFLKQHPPFSFLPERVLLDLASKGRVKFHEGGEIVFSRGQPRNRYLYVIQQGKVRIVDETPGGDRLIDLRGEGDLLGLQGVISDGPYLNTAKTDADTILYGIDRDDFIAHAERTPKAKRYLAAYFTLNPAYSEAEPVTQRDSRGIPVPITLRKGGLLEVKEPHTVAEETLVTVPRSTTVRDVARRLQSKRVACVVVVDDAGRAVGKLTDADLRDRVVDGGLRSDAPVSEVMATDLVMAHPDDSTGDLLVRLTRTGKSFLIVTEDGTPGTPVLGLVYERNLFLQYGRFPTVLGEAIGEAPDLASLRTMRERMEALLLEFLEDRAALPWLMKMTGVLNRRMARRIIGMCREAMDVEGFERPTAGFSWLMMGSGGRDELLIRSAVYHAMVYEDPDPDEADTAAHYYRELARRVGEATRQCGFLESEQGVLAQRPGWCLPISEMEAKFRAFIESPVENVVYTSRDAFDFRSAEYQCPLARRLRRFIEGCIRANPAFIRHMASNSLLNQPPRTIYQGYVVDEKGIQREELAIKAHALLPLVDMGRVFAMEGGALAPTGTCARLRAAAQRLRGGEDEATADKLEEASEAFLVAHFARVCRGLMAGTDGAVIRPNNLDPETRTLLKTAFRTILDVLELLAARHGLSLRA